MSVGQAFDALSIVNLRAATRSGAAPRTRHLRLRRTTSGKATRNHGIGTNFVALLLLGQAGEHRAFETIGYVVAVDLHVCPHAVVGRDIGTNVADAKADLRKPDLEVEAMRARDRPDDHDYGDDSQHAMHA